MSITAPLPSTRRRSSRQPLAAKVPEITALFWVIKVLTTGDGEAASDWMLLANPVLGLSVGVAGFATAIWLQLHVRRYLAAVYWSAVAMVALFGTMVADIISFLVGVPLPLGALLWAAALTVVLYRWHRSEGTLSIHSVTTRRRELYYWATVLVTFILGTVLGDMLASSLHLGFLYSGILFAVLMSLPFLARRWFHLNGVAAFWIAYVLTRPFGASFADWFGKLPAEGGLGLGMGPVTIVTTVVLVALVAYFASTRRDVQPVAPSSEAPSDR